MPTLKTESEAEWLAVREHHVGGSEIAALFYVWRTPDGGEVTRHLFEAPDEGDICLGCLSPYTTGYRLWHEKAGRLKPKDFGNERIDAGTHLEPAIARWAGDKWDWKIRRVKRYFQHGSAPGWGASLDYEVHEKGSSGQPVEIKNVDGLIFRDQWSGDDDRVYDMPMHIHLQLQHQIGAVGAEVGHVVCCVAGNDLKRGIFEVHKPTQARIAEAVSQFWHSVAEGVSPDWLADFDTVADVWSVGPPGDKKAAPVDMSDDEYLAREVRRLERWKAHQKFVEGQVEMIKGRVGARIGERYKIVTPDYRITWPTITRPAKMVPGYWMDEKTYRGGMTVTRLKK